jgi:shikimate 5-dehydrogenase
VVDVTFEKENTNLVSIAKKLGLFVATGWDMFTYQGQVCLEGILKEKVDFNILKKHVVAGLSVIVT